jgi:Mg2+/citrate symporter
MSQNLPLWITLVTSLVSGLVSALFTTWIFARRENRRFRVDTLKRFAANRYHVTGDEFTRALNETFVAFNDSRPVMAALEAFHHAVTGAVGEGVVQDRLVALYKAMCTASKINLHNFNDSFFLTPFNTRATSIPSGAPADRVPPAA